MKVQNNEARALCAALDAIDRRDSRAARAIRPELLPSSVRAALAKVINGSAPSGVIENPARRAIAARLAELDAATGADEDAPTRHPLVRIEPAPDATSQRPEADRDEEPVNEAAQPAPIESAPASDAGRALDRIADALDGVEILSGDDAVRATRALVCEAEHGAPIVDAGELAARLAAAPDASARTAIALDPAILRAAAFLSMDSDLGAVRELARLRDVVRSHKVSLKAWDDGIARAIEAECAAEDARAAEAARKVAALRREADEAARTAKAADIESRRREAGEELARYVGSFDLNGATFDARPGLTTMERQGKRGPERTDLANFSARIIERVTEFAAPDAAPINTLRVGIAFASGEPMTGEINAGDIVAGEFIEAVSHGRAEVYGGRDVRRHLCIAMQRLSADTPVRTRRAFTGYVRDTSRPEGWIYQHAAGAIAAEGAVEGAEVRLPDKARGFALPAPPEGDALRAAALAVLDLCEVEPARVILPAVSLAVRAALGPTEKGLTVYLYGPTGTGKSLVASIVQRFYGAALRRETLSFLAGDTSYGAAMKLLAAVGDAPVFCDDAKTERGVALASEVIHAHFNRSVSSKLRRDRSEHDSARSRAHLVVAAELAPRGESVCNRVCAVAMTEKCADLARFDALATEGAFARATAALLSWHLGSLARDGDGDLGAIIRRDRSMASAWDLGAGDRAAEVFGPLAVGADTLATWLADMLPEESQRAAAVRERACKALAELAAERVAFVAEEDPARRGIELAADALRAGEVHVVHVAPTGRHVAPADDPETWGWRKVREDIEPRGERLGYLVAEHPEHVAVNREALLKAVKARARGNEHALPLDARSIGPALERAGLLKVGTEKDGTRYTPRVRIGKGTRVRLLLIRRDAFTGDDTSAGDEDGDA